MFFYSSWWEAIKNLPRDVQGDVLTAIIEYGLYGETTEQLKPIAKAMLAMAKHYIDRQGKPGGFKGVNSNENNIIRNSTKMKNGVMTCLIEISSFAKIVESVADN